MNEPSTQALAEAPEAQDPTPDELMAACVEAQANLDAKTALLYASQPYLDMLKAQEAQQVAVKALENSIPMDGDPVVLMGYEDKWASRTTTNYSLSAVEGVVRSLVSEDVADQLLRAATKTTVAVTDLRSEVDLALAKGLVPPDILERIEATAEKKTSHSFAFKPLPKSRGGKGKGA